MLGERTVTVKRSPEPARVTASSSMRADARLTRTETWDANDVEWRSSWA